MRECTISGWGTSLPEGTITFGRQTRYRVAPGVSQLDLLADAAISALDVAGLEPGDVDCIIAACAAGLQPIPCTAALVMERVAPGARAAAFDVNSTCTSFITAVDIASRYIADGEYRRVLIVSGDVGSRFLDPDRRESYELFSDAAAAIVLTATAECDPDEATADGTLQSGVIASLQQTWPEHAHDTEVRGGGSLLPPQIYAEREPGDYLFSMDGRRALMGMLTVLPGFFERFFVKAGVLRSDIDLVVPHQASGALPLAMRKLGFTPGTYIDNVAEYGNMVSASVPFTLARCLDEGRVGPGDTVVLCGTAAGLTANALALRL